MLAAIDDSVHLSGVYFLIWRHPELLLNLLQRQSDNTNATNETNNGNVNDCGGVHNGSIRNDDDGGRQRNNNYSKNGKGTN